jgi:hypothetical protein
LLTNDGGATWTPLRAYCQNELNAIDFVSPTTGFVVGVRGSVLNTSNAALPVELVSFDYQLVGKNVQLSWATASEINNAGFEVERRRLSQNESWQKIGFVQGRGMTTERRQYAFVDANVSGKTQYRLKQLDFDGQFEYSNILEVDAGLPKTFALNQNYPNPFNPTTVIAYQLPISGQVKLELFDVLGRKVSTLVNAQQGAGVQTYALNAQALNLSSGTYFYRLTAGGFTETKRMMLVK